MNVQCRDIAYRLLTDHRDKLLVEGELVMLRSKVEELKRVAVRVFASFRPFRFSTLQFHIPDLLVDS